MAHHQVNQLIHILWSTNNQQHIISPSIKSELYAYITTLVTAKKGRIFAIDGSGDHIHILTLLPPEISLSALIGHVKACSSKWIKFRETADPHFTWQNGYLAMSTQGDKLNSVCSYIRSEEKRHQSKSYIEEFVMMLKQQNIAYNEQYYLQNSYAKVFVHAVWSTYNRIPYLDKCLWDNLHNQMKDVISNSRGNVHAIGGVEDHIHILMETPKDKSLSDLIRDLKVASTHWLKTVDRSKFRDFEWQTGYSASTISYSSIENVKGYIDRQEEHHRHQTYQTEWDEFLHRNGRWSSGGTMLG